MDLGLAQNLVKYGIIEEFFDYQGLDDEIVNKYKYFEQKFELLFADKAIQYKLKDCYFYISNKFYCNAFARSKKGYNIIGITSGYVIKMLDIFNEKYFSSLILIALINDVNILNAYADLCSMKYFDISDFMLNCSIQFTFGHEFQHILQFNSSTITIDYYESENFDEADFDIQKHAWEFDADRFASFEVLKYVFEIKRRFKVINDEVFLCMMYLGLSSIVITKIFFYFKIKDSVSPIGKVDFYTKKYLHPHPVVRILNIIEYFFENVKDSFVDLRIDIQGFLNNVLGISKIYFDSYLPKSKIMDEILLDLHMYLDEINKYNVELYDYAVNNKAIRDMLIKRGINFD
ncbi:hypothetical protein [Hymenobacter sp. BT559]|uniref:hypothetical protein n=1 Tax=Hymenobacter sp. BT559 TaxID=2795729 RepID=UPI0018ECE3EB|nr:hypothetical protein [Hymenobacter sp. BT559]MBJ6145426.1 hypothetical protein [Hymenobacter sp. BT559]